MLSLLMDRIICFGVEVVVEVAVGCLVDLDDEDNDDERVVDLEKVNGRTLLLFTFIYVTFIFYMEIYLLSTQTSSHAIIMLAIMFNILAYIAKKIEC